MKPATSAQTLPRPLSKGIHILDSPKPSYPIYALHSAPDVSIQTSCGAAIRVKPRARLCEPWVSVPKVIEPRRGDRKHFQISARYELCRRFAAPKSNEPLTQDSQSLALGLTLTAAPQLLECSRLMSSGCNWIGTNVSGGLGSSATFLRLCESTM